MILKGSQRSGADALAAHLTDERGNDHVEVADLRHTAAQDVRGAFREIAAAAGGTRCKQPFFQVSVNPPEGADLSPDQFEKAFAAIEKKYPALKDQPRAVIYHEKEGRRHAHAVWSRIDTQAMKAVPLPHSRIKLREAAQSLCREFGLDIPAGMQDKGARDPLNFDRHAWQQAKRLDEDPRELKAIITEAFRNSDSAKAFAASLEQHALMLARGDKRGFVVVHHSGAALPLHRFLGLKLGETKARLGDPKAQITVDQARAVLRDRMTARAEKQMSDLKARHERERQPARTAAAELRAAHRTERAALRQQQQARHAREAHARAERLRSGLKGFWQRLTGDRGRIVRQNAAEAQAGRQRDRAERHEVVQRQLAERRALQQQNSTLENRHRAEREQARVILGHWLAMDKDKLREDFDDHSRTVAGRKDAYQQARDDSARADFERRAREETEKLRKRKQAERERGRDSGREREP